MFCIDDCNLWEIVYEGYIDVLICCLIEQYNVLLYVVYCVVSWLMVCYFGLNYFGLLVLGKQVDIVLLSDVCKVMVQQVLVKGELIDV